MDFTKHILVSIAFKVTVHVIILRTKKMVGSMKRSMDGLSHFLEMCQKNGIVLNLKKIKRCLERIRREREASSFACNSKSFFPVREDVKQILMALFMSPNMPGVRIEGFYNE